MTSATRSCPHSQFCKLARSWWAPKPLGRKIVRQSTGALRGFGERRATFTTYGHRTVRDDLGDHIQDRTYGPLAHDVARSRALKPPNRL